MEAAHAPGQRVGRHRPVHAAVLFLDDGGEAGPVDVLRRRLERARSEAGQGQGQDPGPHDGQPRLEVGRGLVLPDGRGAGEERGPGVQAFVDEHGGHARLPLAVHDRPLNGGRPAVARQERPVDVDGSAPRDVDHASGQDLAVGHHDLDIGL
jgi:hypothetical protein